MVRMMPAITAAAIVCWFNAGEYESPRIDKALSFVQPRLRPRRSDMASSSGHYFYGHLYLSQAMYLSGDDAWHEYFPSMSSVLMQLQRTDGSWDGDMVGPVYGTSVALIILQLPYKNLPIMQR